MRQPPSLLRADSHAERAVVAGRRRSLPRFWLQGDGRVVWAMLARGRLASRIPGAAYR
mgnify:CR=1 FL=1